MPDFVTEEELLCEDAFLRETERKMLYGIKHVTLIEDDYVLSRYYKQSYVVHSENADFGVGLQYEYRENQAVMPNHPIQDIDGLKKLKKRTFEVDRQASLRQKEFFDELFDGIIPVRMQLSDCNLPQLSRYAFDLIGMENMYFWMLDEPNAMHALVEYLKNDYIDRMKGYEKSGVLTLNNENEYAGSGSYGYISGIKQTEGKKVFLKDMWVWLESQETDTVSPEMFSEFFLTAMSEIAELFHYTYYGCCEHLHDRFHLIEKKIKNIRCVSVSPWSDKEMMGELIGKKYVYSAKASPQFISGERADTAAQKIELSSIYRSLQDKKLVEYIYRDVYRYHGDAKKFNNWVSLVKNMYN